MKLQRVKRLNLPNGAAITTAYDSVARETMTALVNSGGSDLDSYAYTYNQANERTEVVRTAGDYVNYSYDNEGELTGAVGHESGGTTRTFDDFSYAYDAAGNLLTKELGGGALNKTAFGLNSLNQITNATMGGSSGGSWVSEITVSGSTTTPATNVTVNGQAGAIFNDNSFSLSGVVVSDGTNAFTAIATNSAGTCGTNTSVVTVNANNSSFACDLNGNLLTDGNRNFAYDDENELISVWNTNVWRNDFIYDGKLRRRIEKDYIWSCFGSA